MLWRGAFLLLLGQILFLASGYGVSVVLARWLGPEEFGAYGIVYSLLMVFELCVVAGIPNALQRFVGENPAKAFALHRVMLRWQIVYTAVVFGLAFLTARFFLGIFNDPRLAAVLQIAIIDILFFSFYWYYAGMQIGLKNFGRQTVIASVYSVSKFAFITLLLLGGYGVTGAFVGNILGSLCGLALGMWWTRLPKQSAEISKPELLHFIVPNILYSIGMNLFFYVDLWAVKYYMSGAVVGFYNAASTIGRIPYSFAIALAGALLPSLAFAVAQSQKRESEHIIRQALRLTLLTVLPLLALVSSSATPIATMFFGEAYAGAGGILRVLMAGLSIYAIFMVVNTIAMAKGGMKMCTIIVFALLPLDVLLNWYCVPRWGAAGAAAATTATMLTGVIANSLYVKRIFNAFINLRSLVRILFAATTVFALSHFIPTNNAWELLAKLAVLMIFYILLLRVFGEVDQNDIAQIKNTFSAKFGNRKTETPKPEVYATALES